MTSGEGDVRQLRTPHDALKQLVLSLGEVRSGLPQSRVVPARSRVAHIAREDDPDPTIRHAARAKLKTA